MKLQASFYLFDNQDLKAPDPFLEIKAFYPKNDSRTCSEILVI
jgi:hypothetical protein